MIKLGTNSIGAVYLGSNKIGKAYLGSNLVFQSGTQPQPALIPYIRGGADGSYIDTGITPDNTTRVIIWARNWNPATSNNMLFGYMDSSNNTNGFSLATWSAASTGRIGVYYGVYNNPYVIVDDAFKYLSGYHKYELDAGAFKVDDVTIATAPSATISTNNTLHLFGRNTGGTHSNAALPIDICACKIYKNDVLVRDYTAVNSPSVGLYDAVSDTVFTNAGSGSFTYGTFNSSAYTPLEYIAASGSSYFLTPAIGSYSLPIVTKFRPTATNAEWFSPIGGRDNTNGTNRCEIYTGNTTYSNARIGAVLGDTSEYLYSTTTAGAVRNKDVIVVKNNNTFTAYYNNAILGSAVTFSVASSYSTGAPLSVGTTWENHLSSDVSSFVGNIYYVGLGGYNLVPAKVAGVAGMYDTYNDIFYPSTTSTPFTAGPEL